MSIRAPVLVLIVVALLTGCGGAPAPTATPAPRTDYKLGLVLNAEGTIRDGTFNELAYNGARRAARDFGLQLKYRETIEEKDYPGAIEQMVTEGHNIVITVGFQMLEATLAAAQQHAGVHFIGVDYAVDDPPPNFAGLVFREDQGGFLAGALAGMMTQSNIVGVIGGVKLPPVERFVNGFVNGAHYVNPEVTALSVFTTSFADVQQGRSEADKMIAQRADVIFGAGGLTGSSGIVRAAEQGVYVIGVDQDEFRTTFKSGINAERILTSAVKGVDTGVYLIIERILEGRFEGGALLLSAANCGIRYAPFHGAESVIPEGVKTRLEAIWQALASETLTTGAEIPGAAPPEPLAPGALPAIGEQAPLPGDCAQN